MALDDRRASSEASLPGSLREGPFRVFFPLGAALGGIGVVVWLLFGAGLMPAYLGGFHAVTMTQAFLPAFAAGFLLTAIPKRTHTPPASSATIALLAALFPVVSFAALADAPIVAQLAYIAALATLAAFALRRFRSRVAGRRPPPSFVLVPVALASGLVGAGLAAASAAGLVSSAAGDMGRALTTQGVFLALALGVGAFFLPLALHGEAAADLGAPGTTRAAIGYGVAGVAVIAGLLAEQAGAARVGPLLRGGAAVAVLLAARAWRIPSRPGHNRVLVWLAAWAIPAGMLGAAIWPAIRVGALHVTFVGGFGLLAFAVAAHVTLAHTDRDADQAGKPIAVALFGLAFAGALVARVVASARPELVMPALAIGAALWLAAAAAWGAFLFVPRVRSAS